MDTSNQHCLILGGARSGKSTFAEQQALSEYEKKQNVQLHYVATAEALDNEMSGRIAKHQSTRDRAWQLHESPYELSSKLNDFNRNDIVLVDCLTVWLNNIIYQLGKQADEHRINKEMDALCEALLLTPARVYLVSNEVGMGIVPLGEVTRLFIDHSGWMNQRIAAICDNVYFVAAGIPMKMKG